MTVVMKIDLVGPERRGLALGLNEAAGYGGVAVAAAAERLAGRRVRAARRARRRRRRRSRLIALVLSVAVRARHRRARRARAGAPPRRRRRPRRRRCGEAFARRQLPRAGAALLLAGRASSTTSTTRLAWGLVPLFLAAHGAERRRGRVWSPAIYPGRLGRRARSGPATGPTASGASR